MKPVALITGITGQDGSYLAERLLSLEYEVHGTIRNGSRVKESWIGPSLDRITLHEINASFENSWATLLQQIEPREIFHLASQTHVAVSFQEPFATTDANSLSTLHLLEAVRKYRPETRLFHASSSQIFGQPDHEPQDENTPHRPLSPYGASKSFATQLVKIYRETHGLFAVNGILYNHESPRRGVQFVTAKICRAAAAIKSGREKELYLGDTSAERDWGDARDFIEGFRLALNVGKANDYVFATGILHRVQDVVEIAFGTMGLDWRSYLRTDPNLFRSSEPHRLVGNSFLAQEKLGWRPTKTFQVLIEEMTRSALDCNRT